jgi:glycosyltransferase involved in cell wall biosynthesis
MRVFHLCSTTLNSPYFANLGKGLAAEGVSLLCGSLSDPQRPAWMSGAANGYYTCLRVRSWRHFPRAIFQLGNLLRRRKVDILQTHLFDAGLVGVMAARLGHVPLMVLTRHHLDDTWLSGSRLHVEIDRWMAQRADCVVVPSHAVRCHMMTQEGLSGDNVEVIHYGFDFPSLAATEQDRQRVRAEFGIGSEFVVGCIARFFKNKGHVHLLSALKELIPEIPNVRLLLLGSGDRKMIEDLSRERGLEKRVIFAGYRQDVPACMKAMDVVVHPSLSEAFCQVIIETMGVGTALISTDVGGAPEVITHGETGMLVPPSDARAIARAILELYRNPELRHRIAAAGQKSVRERFTVERMVRQQLDCYHRWLGQSLRGAKGGVAAPV